MMRRGGGVPGKEGDKVMGPLFPRLHVNDSTLKGGGPRAPPRNKMALYEQFSVPAASHRPFNATATASAGQIGGTDRPLFPSFCVPSNEPVRSSDQINTNSNWRDGSAARVESGRISTQVRSRDAYAAGSTAECSSQRRENNTKSSTGKKLTHDDDFTVPSVFCSGGVPPQSAREEVRVQEKSTPFPSTSPYKSGPTMSKSSPKYSNTDKRNLDVMNVSDTRSRDSPSIKDKAPAKTMTNSEVGARTSSFHFFSAEKTGKTDDKASSYREKLSSINVSDKQHSRADGRQTGRSNEDAAESQNVPKAGGGPYSTDVVCNCASNVSEKGLREGGEKRKRSTGHHAAQKDDSSEDSSVDSLPGLEICPEDVVGAIGPKHFWKARRAIVNQQRVFAVQVFELHRLIKVQKLIAASPHLLIEGDPCLGTALVTSKKKLVAVNVEKQISSAKSKDDDDAQLTLQQAEHSKDNTQGNQALPSQDGDVVEVQHDNNNQAVSTGAVSSNPPAATMPAPPDSNKQSSNWCAPPPPNQWLVPVMSPSEGLVYKAYAGTCPPAGSFLAPFYAGCAPLSLPSTPGDYMASPYGIPMPHHHQPQHMGVVGGPPPMPPMYFPPFTMPVMNNPVVSASAVEQASRVAPAQPTAEHLSRTSCNMRNEAVSGGVWRFHSSAARDSELQGSSAASSPFDRQQQQGEARGTATAPPPPIPVSSARNNNNGGQQPQPSSGGSKETPVVARVIRVVPHTARTASESAARIFRSIQMERQQNDP